MANDTLFRAKAPGIMNLLMKDFELDLDSAAAILGNLGHESGGFRDLQEKKPLIPGSEGGWGWAQWTAERRDQFEAYARRNGYDPSSDTANYKWLFIELKGLEGSEGRAIPAVKNAVGLREKIIAFELAFERASPKYKAYDSRVTWANIALSAWRENPEATIDIKDAQPGNTGVGGPIVISQTTGAGTPFGGIADIIQRSKDEARRVLMGGIGLFNALYSDDMIVVQGKQPATPATPAKPSQPTSVKAAALVGAGGLILQLLGIVPPPEVIGPIVGAVTPPTTLGTMTTFLPAIAGIVGKLGGFSPLVGIGSSILDMIVKKRSAS